MSKEIKMNDVSIGQHFLWKDCEYVMANKSHEGMYWRSIVYNITKDRIENYEHKYTEKQCEVKLV